ncbi:MAG: hypothetical protein GXO22_00590, partial [Aquificae bacterium]|nr:hypothetical protein [Aquificota bacterium]
MKIVKMYLKKKSYDIKQLKKEITALEKQLQLLEEEKRVLEKKEIQTINQQFQSSFELHIRDRFLKDLHVQIKEIIKKIEQIQKNVDQ